MSKLYFLAIVALVASLSAFSSSSCTKKEQILTIKDTVVTGGPARPDGLSRVVVQNYINSVYIDAQGVEAPITVVEGYTKELLEADPAARSAIKRRLTDELVQDYNFYRRLYSIYNFLLIEGQDSIVIAERALQAENVSNLYRRNGDDFLADVYQAAALQLENLLNGAGGYHSGDYTFNEFVGFFLLNSFFEDLNMGSENYVKASFQHLFMRTPTEAELVSGVKIIDGASAVLLLNQGQSKLEYVEIITSSPDFYEGAVRLAYLTYLQREASSTELAENTALLVGGGAYPSFISKLLSSEEYAKF